MDARYVFGVRFRLEPASEGVAVDPSSFETKLSRQADMPGENGWLFFRDNLWRGEVSDETHFWELTGDTLGVPVLAVDFRALRTDEEYYEALQNEIDEHLDEFNAETVPEVLTKYFGSSIEVRRNSDDR